MKNLYGPWIKKARKIAHPHRSRAAGAGPSRGGRRSSPAVRQQQRGAFRFRSVAAWLAGAAVSVRPGELGGVRPGEGTELGCAGRCSAGAQRSDAAPELPEGGEGRCKLTFRKEEVIYFTQDNTSNQK
jgi:hypothetical protein